MAEHLHPACVSSRAKRNPPVGRRLEMATSSAQYYTSDFDLASFTSQQWGFGVRYKDLLSQFSLWKIGLKSIELRYIHYNRSNGLQFDQTALGVNFEID